MWRNCRDSHIIFSGILNKVIFFAECRVVILGTLIINDTKNVTSGKTAEDVIEITHNDRNQWRLVGLKDVEARTYF